LRAAQTQSEGGAALHRQPLAGDPVALPDQGRALRRGPAGRQPQPSPRPP
jgi:hypothetical protein